MSSHVGEISRRVIPARGVRSLVWHENDLVDWVAGGKRYRADGSVSEPRVIYGYRFDAAVATPDGEYAAIYERLGTKGLLLRDGEIVREINRSFYQAGAYEYPIALWRLPDGRPVIAHCPDEYCKIEIETIDGNEGRTRLTTRSTRPEDFFHSRLEVSPDGRLLMSAGWVWHPFDALCLFDIAEALVKPETLDSTWILGTFGAPQTESNIAVSNATFAGPDKILVASSEEHLAKDGTSFESHPTSIATYSVRERRTELTAKPEEAVGTILSLGEFAVGFYEHPKLIDLATGGVVARWPEIDSGRQTSSIIGHLGTVPPIARDPARRRFAVADSEKITVVQLG